MKKIIGCVINDPLAVAYFIDGTLCSGFDCFTVVETEGICRGQTVADAHELLEERAKQAIS